MKIARPFLKWAGGKTQLIPNIENALPENIYTDKVTYIEPFVGSGAVLFWILNRFPNIDKAVINDINEDLINTYKVIQNSPEKLISILEIIQREFHALEGFEDAKKEYYYSKRTLFNQKSEDKISHAALFIFLNKTCFNGLYRVNRNNEFNVPMGSYKLPTICDKDNIIAASEVLQKVEILCGDYEQTLEFASSNTFFYFDPPYKPLNRTSNFNSYSKEVFDDIEQLRLRDFCNKLDSLGHKWMLSNSDTYDKFFDNIYIKYNIQRINAKRMINSKSDRRGFLTELLITNSYARKPLALATWRNCVSYKDAT